VTSDNRYYVKFQVWLASTTATPVAEAMAPKPTRKQGQGREMASRALNFNRSRGAYADADSLNRPDCLSINREML
jgi:hypothetical protein